MTDFDHYAEAASLVTMLRDTPLKEYGDSLQAAINGGATGSEIFMALRWNLEKLLKEPSCNDLTRAKAKRLHKELDKALQ